LKYITYKIKALENIKVGKSGSQLDNGYSLSYLPGSALRGAYISSYIKKYKVEDISKDSSSKDLLLAGKIRFFNAYPLIRESRSVPFPNCLYILKEDLKRSVFDNCINELDDKIVDGYEKVRVGEFCLLGNEQLEFINVDKVYNLHINKQRDNENLYRYEAIKKGQSFLAVIALNGSQEEAEQCQQLLQETGTFYLGGSKGSGYGKCLIEDIQLKENNPELFINMDEDDFEDEIYLYCLSDTLYRNKHGQVLSYVDEEFLQDALGLDRVELSKSSIETNIISGYNVKWNFRYPQYVGIKAGSLMKYKIKGRLNLTALENLLAEGVGDRREDGFGRIAILPSLDIGSIEPAQGNDQNLDLPELNQMDRQQLTHILTKIYQYNVETEIQEKILALDGKTKNLFKISDSQLGKMLQIFTNIQHLSPAKGKAEFSGYISHLDESNNKKSLRQLEDVKISGERMVDFLTRFVQESSDVEIFRNSFLLNRKGLKIKGMEPLLTEEYVYQVNIRLLEEYFRFLLRK